MSAGKLPRGRLGDVGFTALMRVLPAGYSTLTMAVSAFGFMRFDDESDPLLTSGWLSERSHTAYVGLALNYVPPQRTPRQQSHQQTPRAAAGDSTLCEWGVVRRTPLRALPFVGMRHVQCAFITVCQALMWMTRFSLPAVADAMQCQFRWDDVVPAPISQSSTSDPFLTCRLCRLLGG